MQASSMSSFIDYFKLFKVYDLKKIEKTGLVKIVDDKILSRKVISVEGNISTANFISFKTANYPNIPFSERYLYVQGYVDIGKSFCFQIVYSLGNKQFKAVYSSMYKQPKRHLENIVHLPISIIAGKWNIAVIDLYQLGMHFGFKPEQMKLIFRIVSIEVRASSKVKGVFQSDYLFYVDKMPKDICLPLRKQQNYFQKYHYFVETTDQSCLKAANLVKNTIEQEIDKKKSIKSSKSVEDNKNQSNDRPQHSLDKNTSSRDKAREKQKTLNRSRSIKKGLPPTGKKKQQKGHQNLVQQYQQNQAEQLQVQAPRPQATMSLSLCCIQGFSISQGNIISIESYLFQPIFMPVHKPITILFECDDYGVRVLTGYNDGSICLWDTIKKTPLSYFITELIELKNVLVDSKGNIVITGLDKMKREVINIINDSSVIFRQISNYNITGSLLVSQTSFQHGLVTFGFENIRLWSVNRDKQLIKGANIYLGQTNRKIRYTSGIIVRSAQDYLAFIVDNIGFITTISVSQSRMLQSMKIDKCGIDQIIQLNGRDNNLQGLISNQEGVIRIINLDRMEVVEQFSLNNRIKYIKQLPCSQEIILTHYNKSIGCLNLQNSMYSFKMRAHTNTITKVIYNQHLNKVVSISKDNSIRIWQYVINNNTSLPFKLQEQYEFVITGEEMVDVVCGNQGRLDDLKYIIVGGDSGKIRQIDIEKYQIKQEIILQTQSMTLGMSKNAKFIICSYASGNSYLLDSNLDILFKYLRKQADKKRIKNQLNGFNKSSKQYYIQNIDEECFQVYSLSQPSMLQYSIHNLQSISCIEFIGNRFYMFGNSELRVYERQILTQRINIGINVSQNRHNCLALSHPIICYSLEDKLFIRTIFANLQEHIDLPQTVSNIQIYHNDQKGGLIICSGNTSFALYVVAYQLNNLETMQDHSINCGIRQLEEAHQPELEISFSKTTISAVASKFSQPTGKSKGIHLVQGPKELKKLYAEEEQIYEEVKQFLFPKKYQETPSNNERNQCLDNDQQFEEDQTNGFCVLLNYGYELRQDVQNQRQVGKFYWIAENNSLLLLTGNGKQLMQHCFSCPVKHKLVHFPLAITSLCISERSHQNIRYLAVSVNGLIKIYNIYSEISFMRSIDAISTSFPSNVIFQSSLANCGRYLVVLSYNNVNFDNKLYINVIEIISGSIVSSSYLSLPAPKNKYKTNLLKDAKEFKMLKNPYKTSLQFVLYNPHGLFYFYRITSMFTLQTMQLQQIMPLCRDKINNLTSACFLNVEQAALENAILAIGTQNGSLVFIDCRSANIMIACVELLPHSSIVNISFIKSDDGFDKLVLFSTNTFITVYNLDQGLNSILCSMEESKGKIADNSQIKRIITLDGQVTSATNIQNDNQQIVLTKCGSLWLLDYDDFVTVKISSIHTDKVNQAEFISSTSSKELHMFSCSDDGTAKLSNLANLQQKFEIYKPRKQAKSFCLSGSFALVSFGDQICIYRQISIESLNNNNQLTTIGSFQVDSTVICIQNIVSTDNYYVVTENQIIIIYIKGKYKNKSQLTSKSGSFISGTIKDEVNVEIQKITDVQNPYKLIVNNIFAPYQQFALIMRPAKVTVWSRKCLKRNINPIQQLSNVHELSYYLIDACSRNTSDICYIKFINQSEYIWGIFEEGIIQIRNYKQHAIVREISLTVSKLTSMSCVGYEQFTFYAGDEHGYLSIINQNGLLIERIKAIESKITGIAFQNIESPKKIMVFGQKYTAIIKNQVK